MSQLITDPTRASRLMGTLQNNVSMGEVPDATAEWAIQHPVEAGSKFTLFLKGLAVPQSLYEFRIHKDGADVPTLISRLRPTFFVSDYAEGMMGKMTIGPVEDAVIRVFNAKSLGVTGWSETDFFGPKGWKHIKQFGLAKCLQNDAPYVRTAHSEQELNERIRVAHNPVSSDGFPLVFSVGHCSVRGRYLFGCGLISHCRLYSGALVALRVVSPQG